jgi:hypothetical protein
MHRRRQHRARPPDFDSAHEHLGYESATPCPLDGLRDQDGDGPADASDAAYQSFRVEKMRFGKPTAEQKKAGLTKERSAIVYNGEITLRGGAGGGLPVHARVQIGHRVDHEALPGEGRQGEPDLHSHVLFLSRRASLLVTYNTTE